MDDPKFDATKTHTNGKKFVLEAKDINDDGVVNIDDLQWEYLEGQRTRFAALRRGCSHATVRSHDRSDRTSGRSCESGIRPQLQ
jgi:hypothetical protein